jgi:outer membrane receptor for monomeric catechols
MISSSHATFLSDVLRKVPGVVVRPGSRMGNVVRLRNCASSVSEGRGAPLVWVDGVRIPNTEVDDAARVADVAGIEIYPSLAGVPATYFDRSASCGTILIWTKSRQ